MKRNQKKSNIITDNDINLNYETNSFLKKLINLFLIPILNILPRSSQNLVKISHKSAEELINQRTTHSALEILYNKEKKDHRSLIKRFFYKVWFDTNNAKAVRNRLKLTKREINKRFLYLLENKKRIRLLSIASGSARGVIEVLSSLDLSQTKEQKFIDVVFLDKSINALEYSKELVNSKGLQGSFNFAWINDTAGSYLRSNKGKEEFDIVEMVGLLDYFVDDKAIQLFSYIYEVLSQDGILITANINNNSEKPFVTNVVDWNMIYRSGKELVQLVEKSGFSENNILGYYEPLEVHSVVVAKK